MKAFLSLMATIGAAALMATPSGAGDLPKTGAFSFKSTTTGAMRFVTVGNGGSYLYIWEEAGKSEGSSPFGNVTTRCFGVGETVQRISEAPHGYCVDRDADGDQIAYRTASEKYPDNKTSVRGWGEAMLGTGKYQGIVASYVIACEHSGPDAGYTNECEGQGNYILP